LARLTDWATTQDDTAAAVVEADARHSQDVAGLVPPARIRVGSIFAGPPATRRPDPELPFATPVWRWKTDLHRLQAWSVRACLGLSVQIPKPGTGMPGWPVWVTLRLE